MFEVQWKAEYLDGTSAWVTDDAFESYAEAYYYAMTEAGKHPEIKHRVRRRPVKGETVWRSWG